MSSLAAELCWQIFLGRAEIPGKQWSGPNRRVVGLDLGWSCSTGRGWFLLEMFS